MSSPTEETVNTTRQVREKIVTRVWHKSREAVVKKATNLLGTVKDSISRIVSEMPSAQHRKKKKADMLERARARQKEVRTGPGITAAQRVLATPELLEQILSELPGLDDYTPPDALMRDILFAQKVCKLWKNVIDHSPLIKKLLFFQPASGPLHYMKWEYEDKSMYDKTLHFGKPIRGLRDEVNVRRYRPHWGRGRHDAGEWEVFFNPLLARAFPLFSPSGLHEHTSAYSRFPGVSLPEASWRRMLFTQPPIASLFLETCREDILFQDRHAGWTVTPLGAAHLRTDAQVYGVLSQLRGHTAWIDGSHDWKLFQGKRSLRTIQHNNKRTGMEDSPAI